MTRLWVRAVVRFVFWTAVVTAFVGVMAWLGHVEAMP